MSQAGRELNEDSETESSASLSRYSTSGSGSCTEGSTTTTASKDSDVTTSSSSDHLTNGFSSQQQQQSNASISHEQGSSTSQANRLATNDETKESNIPKNNSDEVIERSQQRTGQKCDTKPRSSNTGRIGSPGMGHSSRDLDDQVRRSSQFGSLKQPSTSSPSDYPGDRGGPLGGVQQIACQSTLRPASSASSATMDSNNNKSASLSTRVESLSGFRRNNFSKSASGSRLVNRNDARARVCDCLAQDCREKEHSNRRQFIEGYYNSRTGLSSANALSTLNISTPLNRLSECDAITKRLLSSPIRTVNFSEKPNTRSQINEVDFNKSRRASLGTTNTITEQVSLFSSNLFNSLDPNDDKVPDNGADLVLQREQQACDSFTEGVQLSIEGDLKLKQQQGRSLSVCHEETLKPRFKNSSSYHSSNLNRAVSLACGSGSSERLLTIIPLFGCDIKALEQFMKLGLILPPPIASAVDHILAHGIDAIGIFRKSGVKSRILTLKQRIETNQHASLEEINTDNEFSIYDIADLVKMWFRELKPMPIMTKDLIRLISDFLQTHGLLEENKGSSHMQKRGKSPNTLRVEELQRLSVGLKQQINSTISPTQRALFTRAMTFFAIISSKSDVNQMTSQNLAICLTPSLCATESDQTSIITAQKALKYCIDNYRILF